MENTTLNERELEAEVETRLPQPISSKVSAVINGTGNGATAAVAAFGLPKIWDWARGRPIRDQNYTVTAIATVIGTGLGTWYGLHEARQLGDYRDRIGEEIITLRDRVRVLEGKHPERLRSHAQRVTDTREADAQLESSR